MLFGNRKGQDSVETNVSSIDTRVLLILIEMLSDVFSHFERLVSIMDPLYLTRSLGHVNDTPTSPCTPWLDTSIFMFKCLST